MTASSPVLFGVFIVGMAVGATTVILIRPAAIANAEQTALPTARAAAHTTALNAAVARPPATRVAAGAAISAPPARRGNTPAAHQDLDALVRYPPPHVTDLAFYGPTLDQTEAEQLRQDALDELVASMRAAGLPQTDIDALVAQEAATPTAVPPPPADDPDAIAPSDEQQAHELSISLRAAGLPEDHIEGMVDGLYQARDDRQAREVESGHDHDPLPP